MNRQRNKRQAGPSGPRPVLGIVWALLITLAQPLAGLSAGNDCASCGHDDVEETCCCAPETALQWGRRTPRPAAAEASCCSENVDAPAAAEPAVEHDCCCDSVPECPAVPVQLPPVQDIAGAGAASRTVAAGCAIATRTLLGVEPRAGDNVAPGGVGPPGLEPAYGTRLARAAVQSTSRFLTLLSVARL